MDERRRVRSIIAKTSKAHWFVKEMGACYMHYICRTRDNRETRVADVYGRFDAEFITTFDPEHISLMEAVIESIAEMHEAGDAVDIIASRDKRDEAFGMLMEYRKERGLS